MNFAESTVVQGQLEKPSPEMNHDVGRMEFSTHDGGLLTYHLENPDRLLVDHTFVPEHLRGRGVASALMRAVLVYAKETGRRPVGVCSYAAAYLQRMAANKNRASGSAVGPKVS
jgi:uncharacterized protein